MFQAQARQNAERAFQACKPMVAYACEARRAAQGLGTQGPDEDASRGTAGVQVVDSPESPSRFVAVQYFFRALLLCHDQAHSRIERRWLQKYLQRPVAVTLVALYPADGDERDRRSSVRAAGPGGGFVGETCQALGVTSLGVRTRKGGVLGPKRMRRAKRNTDRTTRGSPATDRPCMTFVSQ